MPMPRPGSAPCCSIAARSATALRHIQRAADAGSSEGAHRLALVYAQGLAGTPRNEARALELFEKAAAAGHHARADQSRHSLLARAQGVPRDLVNARAWLEKAAASGDPQALYALGRAMDESSEQTAPDPVRAADLYRRAARERPCARRRCAMAWR